MQESFDSQPGDWRRPFWLSLLLVACLAFSLGFACAVPFAALSALAACTLPRRDAYILTIALWLVNQVVGFGFHHYPWTAETIAWVGAFGLCALLCTFAARQTALRLPNLQLLARTVVAFLVAFVVYEVVLIGFSALLGGMENFTFAVQAKIFALNLIALAGLFALYWAGNAMGVAYSVSRTA